MLELKSSRSAFSAFLVAVALVALPNQAASADPLGETVNGLTSSLTSGLTNGLFSGLRDTLAPGSRSSRQADTKQLDSIGNHQQNVRYGMPMGGYQPGMYGAQLGGFADGNMGAYGGMMRGPPGHMGGPPPGHMWQPYGYYGPPPPPPPMMMDPYQQMQQYPPNMMNSDMQMSNPYRMNNPYQQQQYNQRLMDPQQYGQNRNQYQSDYQVPRNFQNQNQNQPNRDSPIILPSNQLPNNQLNNDAPLFARPSTSDQGSVVNRSSGSYH